MLCDGNGRMARNYRRTGQCPPPYNRVMTMSLPVTICRNIAMVSRNAAMVSRNILTIIGKMAGGDRNAMMATDCAGNRKKGNERRPGAGRDYSRHSQRAKEKKTWSR